MKAFSVAKATFLSLALALPLRAQDNIAPGGAASQTSTCFGRPAGNAIDGNLGNETHTCAGNNGLGPAVWELDLDGIPAIHRIVLRNRASCCGSRLRDIIVSIHDEPYMEGGIITGEPIEEVGAGLWEWPSALWQSDLLNPENQLGAFPGGPASITVEVPNVEGQFVRVTRIPDPDLSGSGGQGNNDEADVLSLAEVEVFGTGGFACPAEGSPEFGDTRCDGLIIDPPPGGTLGDPGPYTVTALASDGTGDAIIYTFSAESSLGQMLSAGPTSAATATFNLTPAVWTISATVDDDLRCDDTTPAATCVTEPFEVESGGNLALGKPAVHSSQLGAFAAGLAVDGNRGNFTHTAAGQNLPATWEVDLLGPFDIAFIDLYNRTSCCGSRLRDITVSVHDVSFLVDPASEPLWASPLLNPENVLGAFPAGPPRLSVELPQPVKARFVRVVRTADPDLSGTGGQGNQDEADVLSLAEVEVWELPADCPAVGDTHCLGLDVAPSGLTADGDPGLYTLTAVAVDDSGDAIEYTFRAASDGGRMLVAGPIASNTVQFLLGEGRWTLSVTVDDGRCPDAAADATCTLEKLIGCPGGADTHCEELVVVGPAGGACGYYELTAVAEDDSGDPILYTFRAVSGIDPPLTAGPQASNRSSFYRTPGSWTLSVTADDNPLCENASDATCTQRLEVGECAENIARAGLADQSSLLPPFEAALAIDGNLGNFTHTLAGNAGLGPAIWELDLLGGRDIASIVLHNRTSCCGSRLRDIIVSIHDVSFRADAPPLGVAADEAPIWESALWESEVLNPENELGAFPLGPPRLILDVVRQAGRAIRGRYVRVTRLPDPDLSGTGGQGNPDEGDVLSLAEVEVFECPGGDCAPPPAGKRFRRGDADASGSMNITDGVFILNFLFVGGPTPSCLDAADADDSGVVNITDGIYVLGFLFLGGPPPPAPFPDCGVDPSADSVACEAFPPCG
jgi:hypothetical protein